MHARFLSVAAILSALRLVADGPADNRVDSVRRIPPPGVVIADEARKELTDRVGQLGTEIGKLRDELTSKPALLSRLPDIQIFHKAVDWALKYDEFFTTNEVQVARNELDQATQRIAALREGRTPWLQQAGPVALGYVSKIDGSVQPYGLVIPASGPTGGGGRGFRLDFWFHGRGEKLGELAFVNDRSRSLGEFAPPNTFVLHPYGRYCNGSRFAGETDAWEALADAQKRFPIDEERLVVRGFSLGGASCWHMTTHFASKWAAAAPGAGFSETPDFLKVFQKEELKPSEWEQKLWRMYDSTDHALNTSMVPLVVYSGEKDSQKQAADVMAAAMQREGLEMTHIIGPGAGHNYEAKAKIEVNRRIDAAAALGRDPLPRSVRFVTHTLKYNRMAWVTVDALQEHWEQARVEASLDERGGIRAMTRNVTAVTFDIPAGRSPFEPRGNVSVEIDGTSLKAGKPGSDRSWIASFHKSGGTWVAGPAPAEGLVKRHDLQGPIDDAFMDSFLFVTPGGASANPAVGAWVDGELKHAVQHWRQHYRGDVRQKTAKEVTDADIAANNLVLWGDPQSNELIARIADRLPVKWSGASVVVGAKSYPVGQHVPALIFPNPLNPQRYVVINSGFTFREYDYLNNARQTSKLPDWVIYDISKPANARFAAGIAGAGFFGERWEVK